MRMGCMIFVTVRTASKRLPRKALLEINGKPLIRILIDRVGTVRNIKNIVVCTTNNKSDDTLSKYLRQNKIKVFRGDNIDILSRLYKAAIRHKVRHFVVVEGDDIFCDPRLIEETCKKLTSTRYEFIHWENLPFGASPLGIKTEKLGILIKNKINKNTETGWGKLILESGLFNTCKLKPKNKKLARPEIRLTVDYKEDFKLVKKIYEELKNEFSLYDIINTLDKHPEWLKINESVRKKYQQNFNKRRVKIILKRDSKR